MVKIVHFDVGGMRYNVAEETLLKHEHTMLANVISKRWTIGINQETLFIDRIGERFQYILYWYRNGQILVLRTVCIDAIRNEVSFFGLQEDAVIEKDHSVVDYLSSS